MGQFGKEDILNLRCQMSNGDLSQAIRSINLEFRREVCTAVLHLGIIGIWWVFKTMRPDEITKGVSIGDPTLQGWEGEVELPCFPENKT